MSKAAWFNIIFYTGVLFAIGLFLFGIYAIFDQPTIEEQYQQKIARLYHRLTVANNVIERYLPDYKQEPPQILLALKDWYLVTQEFKTITPPAKYAEYHQQVSQHLEKCLIQVGIDDVTAEPDQSQKYIDFNIQTLLILKTCRNWIDER